MLSDFILRRGSRKWERWDPYAQPYPSRQKAPCWERLSKGTRCQAFYMDAAPGFKTHSRLPLACRGSRWGTGDERFAPEAGHSGSLSRRGDQHQFDRRLSYHHQIFTALNNIQIHNMARSKQIIPKTRVLKWVWSSLCCCTSTGSSGKAFCWEFVQFTLIQAQWKNEPQNRSHVIWGFVQVSQGHPLFSQQTISVLFFWAHFCAGVASRHSLEVWVFQIKASNIYVLHTTAVSSAFYGLVSPTTLLWVLWSPDIYTSNH